MFNGSSSDLRHWEESGVGLCISHIDGRVTFQNAVCQKLCGGQLGHNCQSRQFTPCRSKSIRNPHGDGAYRFSNEKMAGIDFDILLIHDSLQIVTIIYSLTSLRQRRMEFFEQQKLSAREKQVVRLLIARASRLEIAADMNITENTVKWYLRNIHKKLPLNARQVFNKIRNER